MSNSVQEQVIAILSQQMPGGHGPISAHSTLKDLGMDSLHLVETIFAIEEAFDISIPFATSAGDDGFAEYSVATLAGIVAGLVDHKAA